MFLSIVIPTYNRAHLIGKTLQSVLAQDCDDFEVIVIDDGSTDDTAEVVKNYASDRLRYIYIPNSERGAARNKGTQEARGEYINWFDSDDEMLPNHVSTLKKMVSKNQHPEIITVMYKIKDAKTGTIESVKSDYLPTETKRKHYLIEGNYLACNPVIVRRDIALENPFIEDRNLSASEDYELWLRLLSKYPFVQSTEVTSYLIQHDERSVNTMVDSEKLETRFLTFLNYMEANKSFKKFLGQDYNYFVMRNYLILSVDLAYNKHKKKAFLYLRKALKHHSGVWRQRVFWATLKHLVF